MTDKEKVIKGLECHSGCGGEYDCTRCPYFESEICSEFLAIDVLTLLKEQKAVEPVKWIYPTDVIGFGRCPHCNSLWDYSLISNMFFKHCPRCGREVKWE